ncbi:MAG: DMT family transporter [Gammaproteobacteria bacterium]
MVGLAYALVIMIWATTPLAIQWSNTGDGFVFGVTARMWLGGLSAWLLHRVFVGRLPMTSAARGTYAVAALSLFTAMMFTYWAARHIPSGWLSLVFGLSPIMTGVFASFWLGEQAFSPLRIVGMLSGLAGLALVFYAGGRLGEQSAVGIAAAFVGMSLYAVGGVWVKRLNPGLSGLSLASGSLLFAAPLYLLAWLASGEGMPRVMPAVMPWAIAYLALFGSAFGFSLYFFLLRELSATRVAMITLLTPVLALLLGHLLNHEPVGPGVVAGAGLILGGLLIYESACFRTRRTAQAVA